MRWPLIYSHRDEIAIVKEVETNDDGRIVRLVKSDEAAPGHYSREWIECDQRCGWDEDHVGFFF